jgi:hypothetical protein
MALSSARAGGGLVHVPHAAPQLSADPLVGWRTWRLERRDGVLTLVSMTRSLAWPPREAMHARCGLFERHAAPDPACRCGIYATATPELLARSGVFEHDAGVVGTVAMWGTVVDHALGARCELAYPARIRLVCGSCLAAGRGAVDPVGVVQEGEALLPRCEHHLPRTTGHTAPPSRAADALRSELLANYAVDPVPLERVGRSLRRGRLRLAWAVDRAGNFLGLATRLALVGALYLFVAACALGMFAAALDRISVP